MSNCAVRALSIFRINTKKFGIPSELKTIEGTPKIDLKNRVSVNFSAEASQVNTILISNKSTTIGEISCSTISTFNQLLDDFCQVISSSDLCVIPKRKQIFIISYESIISHTRHILSKLIDTTLTLLENKFISMVL